jgi:hypothetical protein
MSKLAESHEDHHFHRHHDRRFIGVHEPLLEEYRGYTKSLDHDYLVFVVTPPPPEPASAFLARMSAPPAGEGRGGDG